MKNKLTLLFLSFLFTSAFMAQTYTTGVISLTTTGGLAMSVKIDVGTQVTLTLTGPSGRWFALGFNANSMTNGTDVVGVHSAGTLSAFDAKLSGFSAPVSDTQQDWAITSDVTNAGVRTIIATRALNTLDPNDYAFSATPTTLGLIWARAGSASYSYSYHGSTNRGTSLVTFSFVPAPTPPAAPTGAANQTLCSGATLAQLSATGTAIQWYASATGGSALPSNTLLVNGTTYYASQTVNGLESTSRLAVTAVLNTAPAAPSLINGPDHFCYNSIGQSYSIGSVSGATSYIWTTPAGATGSSTATSINLLFTPGFQTGTISVKAQNTCGQSAPTTLVINQHLASATNLTATACESYTFNGQDYTQSGTYTYQDTTIWGCDSVVVLNLTIHNTSTMTQTESACGSFSWNGQSYFNSGFYSDTLQTSNGCDSIINLDLTVHPIVSQSFDTTVLDLFVWNGIEYATSGTYTQFFSSIHGCDSSVTYNVTIEDSGLDEHAAIQLLYPNPVKGNGIICIDGLTEMSLYHIYSISGVLIQTGQAINSNIALKNLPNGNYFIQIKEERYPFSVE